MVKKLVEKIPVTKAEKDRTATEKLVRDIVCFAVVLYAGLLAFFMVDAQVKLVNAQTDQINAEMSTTTQVSMR